LDLYRITKIPKEERYGLTSQTGRAAVSIPSNITEGYVRKTTADDLRSLYIAYGFICELETQLLLSGDLNYVNKENLTVLKDDTEEVERMLKALIKLLEKKRLNA
jgi:four helix bundle protein